MTDNLPNETLLAKARAKSARPIVDVGTRTPDAKLIRRYHLKRSDYIDSEFYDLTIDPDETMNRYDVDNPPNIQTRLNQMLVERDLLTKLERFSEGEADGVRSMVNSQVENRLSNSGTCDAETFHRDWWKN